MDFSKSNNGASWEAHRINDLQQENLAHNSKENGLVTGQQKNATSVHTEVTDTTELAVLQKGPSGQSFEPLISLDLEGEAKKRDFKSCHISDSKSPDTVDEEREGQVLIENSKSILALPARSVNACRFYSPFSKNVKPEGFDLDRLDGTGTVRRRLEATQELGGAGTVRKQTDIKWSDRRTRQVTFQGVETVHYRVVGTDARKPPLAYREGGEASIRRLAREHLQKEKADGRLHHVYRLLHTNEELQDWGMNRHGREPCVRTAYADLSLFCPMRIGNHRTQALVDCKAGINLGNRRHFHELLRRGLATPAQVHIVKDRLSVRVVNSDRWFLNERAE